MMLERLEELVCPYCNETFEVFSAEPELLTDGDRVVAFKATCAKCSATAHLGAESLVREPIVRLL
jgi:thymidine kinase